MSGGRDLRLFGQIDDQPVLQSGARRRPIGLLAEPSGDLHPEIVSEPFGVGTGLHVDTCRRSDIFQKLQLLDSKHLPVFTRQNLPPNVATAIAIEIIDDDIEIPHHGLDMDMCHVNRLLCYRCTTSVVQTSDAIILP